MAAKTDIAWAGATWSPVHGCTEISPGCRNCYAKRMAARGLPGHRSPTTDEPFAIMRNGRPQWTGRVELIESQLEVPLHWKKPRVIFVNSISDTFHERVPFDWIDRIMAIAALCPQHTFLFLTKRTERMWRYLIGMKAEDAIAFHAHKIAGPDSKISCRWPLPNVWLGCTAEDQERAGEREPYMDELADRGWNTFVSYEPVLGPVDWSRWGFLRWVVCGGESGPGARPAHPDWFRAARDFAGKSGIPFLFKQWGEWAPAKVEVIDEEHSTWSTTDGEWPDGMNCAPHFWGDGIGSVRVGKRSAGRQLDGQFHDARPDFGGAR